ncbi:hypothetical protein [Thaumasiovibrio sp. DFM-14]|uniref:hypothetical protein n=1 Tax=Thaumasiovibrio sp. DFM-14 TaxID=3384792 RepID=UPI0039A181D0
MADLSSTKIYGRLDVSGPISSAFEAENEEHTVNKKLLDLQIATRVPTSRTINGKALTANVTLAAADVGAATSAHNHDTVYSKVDHTHAYVPTSRTINGKPLSANVTLAAADVGAATSAHNHDTVYSKVDHTHAYVPTSRTINGKPLSANVTLAAADVGAAATSHAHSQYAPINGDTIYNGNKTFDNHVNFGEDVNVSYELRAGGDITAFHGRTAARNKVQAYTKKKGRERNGKAVTSYDAISALIDVIEEQNKRLDILEAALRDK